MSVKGAIPARISALARTNAALALLCIISLGVLFLVFRNRNSGAEPVPAVTASGQGASVSERAAMQEPSAGPSFKDMPAPASFPSFVYEGEVSEQISVSCSDAYAVVMIFPVEIDYRVNPAAARYNTATPCTAGQKAVEAVDVKGAHLEADAKYYIVKASEGATGPWHDPY